MQFEVIPSPTGQSPPLLEERRAALLELTPALPCLAGSQVCDWLQRDTG